MGKIISIDLGSMNSRVALLHKSLPTMIESSEGLDEIPSIIAFECDKMRLGEFTTTYSYRHPKQVITSILRNLTTNNVFVYNQKEYNAKYSLAIFLQYLKYEAEKYLKNFVSSVSGAVIVVPDYFTEEHREAIFEVCKVINLEVKEIINTSTAILTAHGLNKLRSQVFMVCDFGNNFDFSIVEVDDGTVKPISTLTLPEVGNRLTNCIVDYLLLEVKLKHNIDLGNDTFAYSRLKEAAENAKKRLSLEKEVHINIPFLFSDETGPHHFEHIISRNTFQLLSKDISMEVSHAIQKILNSTGFIGCVDKIILAGGSVYIPWLQDIIREQTSQPFTCQINPKNVVAIGAAVYSCKFTDVTVQSDVFFNITRSIFCNN